jgi:2-aminoethylphosphonate-pyruvate transaminase
MYSTNENNPYLLLTPGPLSTSKEVRKAMLKDWCTWDNEYGDLVQEIRSRLITLANCNPENYTSVLMQGSGTFSVESVLGSVISNTDKILILTNGAYGNRMAEIAHVLNLQFLVQDSGNLLPPNLDLLQSTLQKNKDISHVAFVHCETTTGMLAPLNEICSIVKEQNKYLIVDAMSSFGGVPIEVEKLNIDFLISSANKCIQGVPGFGFIIAKRTEINKIQKNRRSLSLDLYSQWKCMEEQNGKWRFTSPTHTVRAFLQALYELDSEGGVLARHKRYQINQKALVKGMHELGFDHLLNEKLQSPIISAFKSPINKNYNFKKFYDLLKSEGFVIYPGKVTEYDCFRIGNIGEVYLEDISRLLGAIRKVKFW